MHLVLLWLLVSLINHVAATPQTIHSDKFNSTNLLRTWTVEGGNCSMTTYNITNIKSDALQLNCNPNKRITLTKTFSTIGYKDIFIHFDASGSVEHTDILQLHYKCGSYSYTIFTVTYQLNSTWIKQNFTHNTQYALGMTRFWGYYCDNSFVELTFTQLTGQIVIDNVCITGTILISCHTFSSTNGWSIDGGRCWIGA
eukprot:767177_1